MGLDTSHSCWHGPYNSFNRWREFIAELAGMPPLMLMDGFYSSGARHIATLCLGERHDMPKRIESLLPIKWECLKPSPLHELLYHSDCEGEIPCESCAAIADALEALLPFHRGRLEVETKEFIAGLRLAAERKENVVFH